VVLSILAGYFVRPQAINMVVAWPSHCETATEPQPGCRREGMAAHSRLGTGIGTRAGGAHPDGQWVTRYGGMADAQSWKATNLAANGRHFGPLLFARLARRGNSVWNWGARATSIRQVKAAFRVSKRSSHFEVVLTARIGSSITRTLPTKLRPNRSQCQIRRRTLPQVFDNALGSEHTQSSWK